MTVLLILGISLAQSYYFADVTIYDPEQNAFRSGMHLLIGTDGRVAALGLEAMVTPADCVRMDGGFIMPHYADFYVLLQERGLGLDEDLDPENQRRIGETFRQLGIGQFRDPVFPSQGVTAAMAKFGVHAQRGYLALEGGPGAAFGTLVDPTEPMSVILARLPSTGPITLWWTQRGTDTRLKWPQKRGWLIEFLEAIRRRKQSVGAFIEGARSDDLLALKGLAFDFVEGLPDQLDEMTVVNLANAVWVPLLALNDKRYCARNLDARLAALVPLNLYDSVTLERARTMSPRAQAAMLDRCKVWQKRQPEVLQGVQRWLKNGGRLAIGSAGGHPFSFSGELTPEIEIWRKLGVDDKTLLKAIFETTPQILGGSKPYLRIGKPAHFIVYRNGTDGFSCLGRRVDLNFSDGSIWDETLLSD